MFKARYGALLLLSKNVYILDNCILDQCNISRLFLGRKCEVISRNFLFLCALTHSYIELFVFSKESYYSLEICFIFQCNTAVEKDLALNTVCVFSTFYWILVYIFVFFLIGIHSMQDWTATTRHGVTRKRTTKRLKDTWNQITKNLQLKISVNSKIIGQRKPFYRQRIPESSCARKETVDKDIVVTSRNGDRKIMVTEKSE